MDFSAAHVAALVGGGAGRRLDLLVVGVAVVRFELGAAAEGGAALAQVLALAARPLAAAGWGDGAHAGVALVVAGVHLVHQRVVVAEVLAGGGRDFGRR